MSLAELFARQEAHLGTLVDLLHQEFDTLLQHPLDGEALSELASAKQQQLRAIEQLETQRRDEQARRGHGDSAAGAERTAREDHCLDHWLRVLDCTRRAQHLNRLNGALIQQQLEHNMRMLGTLRELAGNELYSTDGQSRKRGSTLSCKA
ncbi:MAG TPA: flagellar export chaperone FlgN [Porticoccaceae bacterium]